MRDDRCCATCRWSKPYPEVVEYMDSQEQKAVESLAKIVYGGAENE